MTHVRSAGPREAKVRGKKRIARQLATLPRIVIRGREITFFEAGTGKKIACPDDFFLVHDVSGKTFRSCDVYAVRAYGSAVPVESSDRAADAAKRWWGRDVDLVGWQVDVPRSGWKRVCQIDAIWYRRDAAKDLLIQKLDGPYQHRYDPPVQLYRTSAGPLAYRIALPDGCIVDERGFVDP